MKRAKQSQAKFCVIVSNVQTDSKIILKESFTTFNKCQEFVDKMNQKNCNSPIVFMATKDLRGLKKKQIEKLFKPLN